MGSMGSILAGDSRAGVALRVRTSSRGTASDVRRHGWVFGRKTADRVRRFLRRKNRVSRAAVSSVLDFLRIHRAASRHRCGDLQRGGRGRFCNGGLSGVAHDRPRSISFFVYLSPLALAPRVVPNPAHGIHPSGRDFRGGRGSVAFANANADADAGSERQANDGRNRRVGRGRTRRICA